MLLAAVALAGALAGATTPSRDMLVRAAAPPGASGKVFGFVYSGLDLGATLTPAFVGSLLDAGHPGAVFVLVPAVDGAEHPDRHHAALGPATGARRCRLSSGLGRCRSSASPGRPTAR